MVDVPPQLADLAPLVGIWEGAGTGEYPTIEPFGFVEALEITVSEKPFLQHTQRTAAVDDGRPLHSETGYWRVPAPGRVELVLAHPTGVAELCVGTLEDGVIHLRSISVHGTGSAKVVETLERWYEPAGDELRYHVSMGAVGQPHQHHLAGVLHRVG